MPEAVDGSEFPELLGDYHVHSTFSDDAHSTIQENIDAAAACGLTNLRLVDHVRRSTGWIPEFLAAVRGARVPEGLAVHTGVEAKLLDSRGNLDVPDSLVIGPGGVDVVLIADHQFPGDDGPWSPRETRERLDGGLKIADALDLLIGALVAAMGRTPYAQLAHCFSILPKIGLSESDLSDEQLTVWAQAAAASGTSVEVNEKWECPGPRALNAARRAGVTLLAATDSHNAGDVGRYRTVAALLSQVEEP